MRVRCRQAGRQSSSLHLGLHTHSLQIYAAGDALTRALAAGLDRALSLRPGQQPQAGGGPGRGSSGRHIQQHVHQVSLVAAQSMYGYNSKDEAFAKIQLYDPRDVKRASELLQVVYILLPPAA